MKSNYLFFKKNLSIALLLATIAVLLAVTAALAAAGTLDTTFGTGGLITTDLGGRSPAWASDTILQPDGKIVVVGTSWNGESYDISLARYNSNGSLDTTFDTDGKVIADLSSGDDSGQAIALQPDGKIVVAGSSYGSNEDFAVARYNTNGSPDMDFGTGGKVTTPVGTGDDFGNSVAILPDGKIVVAGSIHKMATNFWDFGLVFYNSDGTLFGTVITEFGDSD